MDKLSEYIPLILIVGSIIVSVVSGASKKAKEETAKTTLPGRKSGEVIPDEREIPSQNVHRKKIKKQPVKTATPQPVKEVSESRIQAKIDSEKKSAIFEEVEYEPPVLDVENPEAIKQAFIYSEIWNRKEY
jgi:hypothetical protein